MSAKTQTELPGLENRSNPELEDKAHEYLKIRNKRQDLTRREVELKSDLLTLMKKAKKRDYVRDGIEIHIIVEKEKVQVKIADEGDEGDEKE